MPARDFSRCRNCNTKCYAPEYRCDHCGSSGWRAPEKRRAAFALVPLVLRFIDRDQNAFRVVEPEPHAATLVPWAVCCFCGHSLVIRRSRTESADGTWLCECVGCRATAGTCEEIKGA